MQTNTKSVNWEKVYIFISSTFNDMHAERDYLVKQVFPKLSEWCEKRKLRMVDIDLRWGVTEADATQHRNVVNVCLNRIDECRPFFVCFLGQRYGWVPERKDISEETFKKFPGLEETVNKGASTTELEVLHALITPFHFQKRIEEKEYYPSKYAFFYVRDDAYIQGLPQEPKYLRRIYSDLEEADEKRQKELREKRASLVEKIKDTQRLCHIYQACWSKDQRTPEIAMPLQCHATLKENQEKWKDDWVKNTGVHVAGLDVAENPSEAMKAREFNEKLTTGRLIGFKCEEEELGEVILEELKKSIEERFPDHKEIGAEDELQKEIDQQEQFVFVNSEGFIKRAGDFDELDKYVKSDSNKLFVLTAKAGMGKSTLLSNWVDRFRGRLQDKLDQSVHFRFIGASDGSTTVHSLLRLLLREIKEVNGKFDEKIPDDPKKLRNALPSLLYKIGEKGKTVIVLDALNQLETGLTDLSWLPRLLPPNIKLITSFKLGEENAEELYKSFAQDKRVLLAEVKPFEDRKDRRRLIQSYLSQYLKELDKQHIEVLIASEAAQNPLYLKIVLSELRVFGAFANLEEKIRTDFGDTTLSAFEAVLRRLESDPAYSPISPEQAVPIIFGLMVHARHGLSSEELTELAVQVLKMDDSEESRRYASDTVHLFLRQVRPFLARRDGRYDFFYESFKNAAFKRYASAEKDKLPRRTTQDWHKLLAHYFYQIPLWEKHISGEKNESEHLNPPNRRKIAVLPYHLIMAERWDRLEEVLCDLWFVEAKVRAGMVFELQSDYELALNCLPEAQDNKKKKVEYQNTGKKYMENLIAYAHYHSRSETKKTRKSIFKKKFGSNADRGKTFDTRMEIPRIEDLIAPSVKPWSFEDIQRENERIFKSRDRLDRICVFSNFLVQESHALIKHGSQPLFTIQQAYNSFNDGPIAKKAEQIIDREEKKQVLITLTPSQRSIYNPHSALIRILEGHEGHIVSVDITPDGKRVVSGSGDLTVRVWDVERGECLLILDEHLDGVTSVNITPDGRRVVSASLDETLRVWDIEKGSCLHTLKGHKGPIESVRITPNGSHGISGGTDKTLRVWDFDLGKCVKILKGHADEIIDADFTPDRKWAVSASRDGTVRVWEKDMGKCLKTLHGNSRAFESISITPDGKRIAAGNSDGSVYIWDLESGKCMNILKGHDHGVECVDISADGKYALSGGSDNILCVWDIEEGALVKTFVGYKGLVKNGKRGVTCTSITPDFKLAVSGSFDNTLHIWNLETGYQFQRDTGHTFDVSGIQFSPDGRRAVSGSWDKTLRVWNTNNGDCLRTLEGHTDSIWDVCILPEGKNVVSASKDKTIRVWDIESGKCIKILEGHTGRVNRACITPDGRRLISGGSDKILHVWSMKSGRCLLYLTGHAGSIVSLNIISHGRSVLSGSNDKTLCLWDIKSERSLHEFQGHTDYVSKACVAPDGKLAVSRGGGFNWKDVDLRLWDLEKDSCLRILKGHTKSIRGLCFSPHGKQVISGSEDGTIRIWDIKSEKCIQILGDFTEWVTDVCVSPDGKRVIAVIHDMTIRVWDMETGNCLSIYSLGELSWGNLNCLPDGRFSCATNSGQVLLFKPANWEEDAPIVTLNRLWNFGEGGIKEHWDDKITAVCKWCGIRFVPSHIVLDSIKGITSDVHLSPEQSPCLVLPLEAWEEPRLLSKCPHCGSPLKFNPFVVDPRDSFEENRKQVARVKLAHPKLKANDPCFCGSGKKYKRCCGRK